MADYSEISNLFDDEVTLPKYSHKRWVKIHPHQNAFPANNGMTTAINYNCKTIADKLISYSEGYILLNVTASRAALVDKALAPKGSHSFINQAVVRINGAEIDNSRYNYITMAMLNSLEYSPDYARLAEQYCYSPDTTHNHENNTGHATRKLLIPNPAANALTFSVKIPLTYISTFFRALDFPLLNQHFEFDITYRTSNAILRDGGGALDVVINSALLYFPVVELPTEFESKMSNKLSSSFSKTVTWNKFLYQDLGNANGVQNRELAPSIVGVRKLYCVAVPVGRWNTQTDIESTSNSIFTNMNIVIDSEDFYPQDIQNATEAYELVSENFNMGGRDKNTGSLLSYSDWLRTHRYYVFDLSRQKVFESDPRKSQSIRFRGTLHADSRLLFFLAQEKATTFDFTNPLAISTA